jgi:hypothetical protein
MAGYTLITPKKINPAIEIIENKNKILSTRGVIACVFTSDLKN